MRIGRVVSGLAAIFACLLLSIVVWGGTPSSSAVRRHLAARHHHRVIHSRHHRASATAEARSTSTSRHHRRRRHSAYVGQTWTARSTAAGLSANDVTAGEDPIVRAAAVRALGDLNGSAVVVDPNNGRILAMVNQGLAKSAQYQPCSTTKMAIALAALHHGIVNENTPISLGNRYSVNMTQALAMSINAYFEHLGARMGFAEVAAWERLMGLGEKAGWNIAGEDPGEYPDAPPEGGVEKLSSFGEGIYISPLQLAAIVSAIANGGTLYYLQHPRTQEEAENFVPRVKRQLDIANLVPEVRDGMMAAVQYGTARLARLSDEQILGKTGTCSRGGTRFGLFASYLGVQNPRLAVVVVLRGNRSVFGPRAAQIAGDIYRSLDTERYFQVSNHLPKPATNTLLPAMSLPLAH